MRKPEARPLPNNRAFLHAAIVIVVGVLATTLAQPATLGKIPLQNLLKNELLVDRSANAAFFFWMGLPWYLKPLAGVVTDAFPLFGSRRRSYLLIGSTLAVLSWAALDFTPHDYGKLLRVCIVLNTCMVIASTVVGGFMVETAQAMAGSGRLSAVREFVQQTSQLIYGPAGGFLAGMAFGWTTAACAGVMFLLVPATILFLKEQRRRIDSHALLENAGKQLGRIAAARTMWAAAGLMALFYIAPGLITAKFYKQQNDLHLDTQAQGFLTLLYGVGGVCAAVAYGFACRRLNLRKLLLSCLLLSTLSSLGYLFYSSTARARAVELSYGLCFTLAELALMDLAVRATPAGSEGLGFSLMMSVRNLALYGTDWLGSTLLDRFHTPFHFLVLSNAATTLAAVPLVLLLPALLVSQKDADRYEPESEAKAVLQE